MVEALLVVVISALLFQRSYKPVSRKDEDLTDKVRPLAFSHPAPWLAHCVQPLKTPANGTNESNSSPNMISEPGLAGSDRFWVTACGVVGLVPLPKAQFHSPIETP